MIIIIKDCNNWIIDIIACHYAATEKSMWNKLTIILILIFDKYKHMYKINSSGYVL